MSGDPKSRRDKSEQIVAEIMTGGSELAEQVHVHLFLALGWKVINTAPPKDGTIVLVQRNYRMRWEAYANDRVKNARGAEGRWLMQDEDGSWKPARMPQLKLWRRI